MLLFDESECGPQAEPQALEISTLFFCSTKFNQRAPPFPSQGEAISWTGESLDLFGAEKRHNDLSGIGYDTWNWAQPAA